MSRLLVDLTRVAQGFALVLSKMKLNNPVSCSSKTSVPPPLLIALPKHSSPFGTLFAVIPHQCMLANVVKPPTTKFEDTLQHEKIANPVERSVPASRVSRLWHFGGIAASMGYVSCLFLFVLCIFVFVVGPELF